MPDIKEKLVELMELNIDYGLADIVADNLIANGVTIQRWIGVEEALPETSGEYLTISTNGVTAVLPYSNKYKAFNASDDFYKASCVIPCTHWALMPEPPKGK